MNTKTRKYTRLLGLSFLLSLVPAGLFGQTLPITHIDLSSERNIVGTSGSVVYSSGNASGGVSPLNPMTLEAGHQYQWNFSFQIPEDMSNRPVIFYLDNGSVTAGRFIAGIAINGSGELGYLTNPEVLPLAQQMTYLSDITFEENLWYDVSFVINTINIGGQIGIQYALTIPGVIDEEIVVNYVPSALNTTSAARMLISRQAGNGGTNINLRDISLQTTAIPEPATWGAMLAVGGILIGLHLRKRNRA